MMGSLLSETSSRSKGTKCLKTNSKVISFHVSASSAGDQLLDSNYLFLLKEQDTKWNVDGGLINFWGIFQDCEWDHCWQLIER